MATAAVIPQAHAMPGGVTETWGGLDASYIRDHRTTPETVSVQLSINGFVTVDDPQYWLDHGASVHVTCYGLALYDNSSALKTVFDKVFDKNSADPLVAYLPGGGFIVHSAPIAPRGGLFDVNTSSRNDGQDEIWCTLKVNNIPGNTAQTNTRTNFVNWWF
ncbi:hypothetical protein [Kribbella sp. NPDC004536]|uniref:hypothetical protein n=1 Tax=Kribbella sp. NPDC004536 TaxID=3364106 RepID=UPI0036882A52